MEKDHIIPRVLLLYLYIIKHRSKNVLYFLYSSQSN